MHIASKPVSNSGGLEGIRTLDPHNANVVRSQLRYKPICSNIILPPIPFVKTSPVGFFVLSCTPLRKD